MATSDTSDPSKSVLSSLRGWGQSSMPPMGLATLITALHTRPFARLPMLLFTPMLLFSSYLNVAGYKIDAAGLSAAWSGLYVLLAARRRPVAGLRQRFSARGAVRAAAMGLGGMNLLSGGFVYATGNRAAEIEERKERDRWGIESAREERK
ncbi:hypothetical protein BD289DRAFT_107447 [Coniella lustricola]|uniref:Altered inheritance of mitochondria protein 19 n=1 Tax=Coniella lustricola TaxID=2025994 RepID=A0A2T3AGQ5_9PEZI|nr:hypothetical protein BD289DRAFT_107447 [Coniella lustricola]